MMYFNEFVNERANIGVGHGLSPHAKNCICSEKTPEENVRFKYITFLT